MPEQTSTAPRISMKVSAEGDFTYEPSVKRLYRGQGVTWTCAQGPFSISFKDGSPFDKHDYHSVQSDYGWSVTTRQVGASREGGHFHYAVAIFSESERRVFLDAACPEIIVNVGD